MSFKVYNYWQQRDFKTSPRSRTAHASSGRSYWRCYLCLTF